jgi:hypothetical protein
VEWAHLIPLVDALIAAGNSTEHGFSPNQGGVSCTMTKPLNLELLRPLIAQDAHAAAISTGEDTIFCSHCWTDILGSDEVARGLAVHRTWEEWDRAGRPGTWAEHAEPTGYGDFRYVDKKESDGQP